MAETGSYAQPIIAPNAKSVTVTVDGKPVHMPEGSLLIQACEQAGSPVPFYCYHPGLSIAGNCRICLVEIEGAKKTLEISCNIRVADGMRVKTTSDAVLEGRRSVLEYLLINHPLDCPVCDQAGECWLQDYYMEHGLYDQKFDEQKEKKPKKVPIGPTVMLDAERCILCSRCVRFTDEISKTGEFGIFKRGDHSQIGLFPGKELTNNYSGNVVDICPVGALTDRDFRFKCRVWYLGATKSVCPGCSRGCNIEIHNNRERDWRTHIAQGARVMRLKPRYNPDVNQWWMCDAGRYGYKSIDAHRLTDVHVRTNGTLERSSWESGLAAVTAGLQQLRDAKRLDQVGVILSSYMTNENLFVAKRFFEALGVTSIAFARPREGESDTLLIQADKSPNTRGATALGITEGAEGLVAQAAKGALRVLFVFVQDLTQLIEEATVRRAAEALELLVFIGTNTNTTADLAHVVLPSAVYAEQEGTFTNFEGRVQRVRAALDAMGDAQPEWQILAALSSRLDLGVQAVDAASLFADMGKTEHAFKGLTYDVVGDQGAMLTA